MISKKNILITTLSIVTCTSLYTYFHSIQENFEKITTFKECVSAGYPVLPVYPEECKIPGKHFVNTDQKKDDSELVQPLATSTPPNYKNISYQLEGSEVTLVSGKAEYFDKAINATTTVSYHGHDLFTDVTRDKMQDITFILEKSSKNRSSTYYVTTAIQGEHGIYKGTTALFLGESIKPLSTEYSNGTIIVKYLDNKNDHSTKKVKYFDIQGGDIQEVLR